jgi:hypothetical protein
MKLKCYAFHEFPPKLVPARPHRQWMDAFNDRHPYRCLPLSIANANGWEVLCPVPIDIEWNGGPAVADLTVTALKPLPGNRPLEHFCRSNFSRGIATIHTDYLFVTEPGWDLVATGPVNDPKDNAYPLTGIMESDWLPYPFTMNWQIMRPGRVRFEEDEPFCFVFPVPKQALLDCEVEIHRLSDNAELSRQHDLFRNSRDEFMKRLQAGDQAAAKQAWQRYYFTGQHPDGKRAEGHINKLRLSEPVDRRKPLKTSSYKSFTVQQRRVPWEAGSALDGIRPGQSEENRKGRARLDEAGRLTDDSGTYRVNSARDAEDCDFLCVENFMTPVECARLRDGFEALKERVFTSDDIDPYWNSRFLWLADILSADPEAGRLLIEKQRLAGEMLASFYRLLRPIYTDLTQIVQWPMGIFMKPHADNANPDGSPHGMPHRDFAGVAYLNDDYDGGELYFTALDIAVKPKAGMFVGFTGGFHHEHAVLRVTGGSTRLTSPAFFTYAREKADPLVYPEAVPAGRAQELEATTR